MILVHIQSAMASQSYFEHPEIQGLQFLGIVRFMKQLAHISGPLKRDLPCSPEKEIATSVNNAARGHREQSSRKSNESADCYSTLPVTLNGPERFSQHGE
jgi:hypothetical protein